MVWAVLKGVLVSKLVMALVCLDPDLGLSLLTEPWTGVVTTNLFDDHSSWLKLPGDHDLSCSLCSGTVGLRSGCWAPACAWLLGRSSQHQCTGKNPEVCWDVLLRYMGCWDGTLHQWTLNGLLKDRDTCSEIEIPQAEEACVMPVLSIPPYVLLKATRTVAQTWLKSLFLLSRGREHM